MDELEFFAFIISGTFAGIFLFKWYRAILTVWPVERGRTEKNVLSLLPVGSFLIITVTLKTLASFDVVSSVGYIIFYIVIGFAWVYFGVFIMAALFDLSWLDDIIVMNNKAALIAFCGGYFGVTVIYSAANIGDGPGWWCVIFAGGLGTMAWAILALVINGLTGVFERITVERDVPCGIRFGCYLLANAVILGRASAGDWTSAGMTVIEFLVGWPSLLLTIFAIVVERLYIIKAKTNEDDNQTATSVLVGLLYIAVAIIAVIILSPMNENPIYGGLT